MKSLQDIVDHVGPMIRNHLHYLLPTILENASEIDVSELNKYSVRWADDQQASEVLENLRERIVSEHFSMDTIRGVGVFLLFKRKPRIGSLYNYEYFIINSVYDILTKKCWKNCFPNYWNY